MLMNRAAPDRHQDKASAEAQGRLNVLEVVGICGGGLGRHVRGLCQGLLDQGHSVTVAYAPHDVDPAFQRFVACRQGQLNALPLQVPREISPAADLRGVLQLLRLIKTEGPFDVVHGHSAKGGALARIAGRLAGVSTVYTPHSFFASSPQASRRQATTYNLIERTLGHWATSKMITLSEGERAFALKRGLTPEARLALIPNGINEDDLEAGTVQDAEENLERKPLTFGTTLRLTAQKAPVLLVEAFARLNQALPRTPMRLIIAGDGELYEEVEGAVHRSGVHDKVRLLGWREDTTTVMRELDIFVLPSLYEGFSYSVLEAMAAQLPVVSTRVFGAAETISQVPSNVLVPPESAEALADGMLRAATMAEPERLRQTLRSVGESNREYVEKHFLQNEISRRTIGLYHELLEDAPGR